MKSTEYDELIKAATAMHLPTGYDWRLYKAQLWQESRFKPAAKSHAGAEGLAQFMPRTWAQWSARAGYKGASPTDPEAAIFTGALYMAHLIKFWKSQRPDMDRIALALASYNAGKGNMLKAQRTSGGCRLYNEIVQALPAVTGSHAIETVGYVKKILGYYTRALIEA